MLENSGPNWKHTQYFNCVFWRAEICHWCWIAT